jgi:Holliday junction DNA helicase RuvA
MIVTLSGVVSEKLTDIIVLDVQGVGYAVNVPAEDYGRLTKSQSAKFYIHDHIREQSHDLFGFTQPDSLQLFEQLLNVKNVGPKVALAVLDIGSATTVRAAIANGDVRQLQSAKGVGKRAAEQIVVELRDKVGVATSEAAESIVNRAGVNNQDEAVEALVALGYSPQDASAALAQVDANLATEERIKLALKVKP